MGAPRNLVSCFFVLFYCLVLDFTFCSPYRSASLVHGARVPSPTRPLECTSLPYNVTVAYTFNNSCKGSEALKPRYAVTIRAPTIPPYPKTKHAWVFVARRGLRFSFPAARNQKILFFSVHVQHFFLCPIHHCASLRSVAAVSTRLCFPFPLTPSNLCSSSTRGRFSLCPQRHS